MARRKVILEWRKVRVKNSCALSCRRRWRAKEFQRNDVVISCSTRLLAGRQREADRPPRGKEVGVLAIKNILHRGDEGPGVGWWQEEDERI